MTVRLIKSTVGTQPQATGGSSGSPFMPSWTEARVVQSNYVYRASGSSFNLADFYDPEPVYETQYITHPAVAAVPGIPSSPPSAAQISAYLNLGWNSYASSIGLLEVGDYLEFSITTSSRGALIAVDTTGKEGSNVASFSHGVLVDTDGVHIYENGVGALLKSSNTATTLLRIYRLADGSIVYTTNTGEFYVSTVTPNIATPLYAYGLLYAGLDEISTTSFLTGSFSTNVRANFSGSGSLSARTQSNASLLSVGTLVAQAGAAGEANGLFYGVSSLVGTAKNGSAQAALSGVGYLYSEALTGGRGSSSLPLMSALGGDYDFQGIGSVSLPLFTTFGEGDVYTPPAITEGYGILPEFQNYAWGADNDAATGSVTFAYMMAIGDGHSNADAPYNGSGYGIGSGELP